MDDKNDNHGDRVAGKISTGKEVKDLGKITVIQEWGKDHENFMQN